MENVCKNYTAEKSTKFFKVICAFQHFAGKPLKATEAAQVLTLNELHSLETILLKLATHYSKEDMPELQKLSTDIKEELKIRAWE